MWSGMDKGDVGKPLKARVNVACVNSRLVNERIAENMQILTKPEIQVHNAAVSVYIILFIGFA